MGRFFKAVVFLGVAGIVALVSFAYLGDLSPIQRDVSDTVTLDEE
ncbi:hypothetical protein ACFFUT_12035 [Pseudohalocynthiibacter aestuariivivens]|jgi:hypothetical protein|uniref:Uncharacterized protein n=1 Tax=Pseudohalocynthiibacter aestuariivivens TaxID=1591409 RepID=A0ABV5JGD4_9RHOB|nr:MULTISPECIES: hypothetical protein [Pseudohalocynthiibacter]